MPAARSLRVTVVAATSVELAAGLASIADPRWRTAFESADRERAGARSALGAGFLRQVDRAGRFAFVNLLPTATRTDARSMGSFLRALGATPPTELHLAAIGGRRRQLRDLVGESTLRSAAMGDRAAQREVSAALVSGRTVLEVTPWLLRTPSVDVHATLIALLADWQRCRWPAPAERELGRRLTAAAAADRAAHRGMDGADVIRSVADGLHYDPASTPRTVRLLPSEAVRPVVVVVDGVDSHLVVYPTAQPADARSTLLTLSRALGDETRLAIVDVVRRGDTTAAELCAALGAPRTTLLHHLALLRAAGVLTTSVTAGGATVYGLRPDVIRRLRDAAQDCLG